MNDFELVSGLIDALTYLIPILLGVVLLVIGLIRRKKVKGGTTLIGVGVALMAVFGLGAAVRAVTLAGSSSSQTTVVAQSPDQSSETGTTATAASPASTTSAPIPADPLSPTQHVWCLGSDENRAHVVLAGLILDYDDAFATEIAKSEDAVRRFLAGPTPTTSIIPGVIDLSGGETKQAFIEGDPGWEEDRRVTFGLADSWPEGDQWRRPSANVDGPQPGDQASPWAIACATAYEAFGG